MCLVIDSSSPPYSLRLSQLLNLCALFYRSQRDRGNGNPFSKALFLSRSNAYIHRKKRLLETEKEEKVKLSALRRRNRRNWGKKERGKKERSTDDQKTASGLGVLSLSLSLSLSLFLVPSTQTQERKFKLRHWVKAFHSFLLHRNLRCRPSTTRDGRIERSEMQSTSELSVRQIRFWNPSEKK